MSNADKLFRIHRTCYELLEARGYIVAREYLERTKDEFISMFGEDPKREDLTILAPKQDDPTDQIFVFFPEDVKVGVKSIKTVCEQMKADNVKRAIMVVISNLTPFARQCLEEVRQVHYIETFQEMELLVNITKHKLVPRHQILTKEQKDTLLDRYKVKETQLPRIQFNDPVARFYGMQRGEVVRIVRASETAGRYVTYRLCV